MARDPVCHVQIDEHEASSRGLSSTYQGHTAYFCSSTCKEHFEQSPQLYAGVATAEDRGAARELLEMQRDRIERLERRLSALEARIEELEEAHAGGI
ncbi:MAG: YHS domain-containing protein [Chloroflexi bacterium]|nr:YHS domain-containing protein [Chloroflexota bacterium]